MAQRGCPGAALYSNAGGKLRHVTVFSGMQRIRVGISEPGAATPSPPCPVLIQPKDPADGAEPVIHVGEADALIMVAVPPDPDSLAAQIPGLGRGFSVRDRSRSEPLQHQHGSPWRSHGVADSSRFPLRLELLAIEQQPPGTAVLLRQHPPDRPGMGVEKEQKRVI